MKKILAIFNDAQDVRPFFDFFEDLKMRGYDIALRMPSVANLKNQKNPFTASLKKISLGPRIKKNKYHPKAPVYVFFTIYPFLFLKTFAYCLYLKFFYKLDTLLLTGYNDKLLFSPASRWLRIQTIWLELPFSQISEPGFRRLKLYKFCSLKAQILYLTESTKPRLIKAGLNEGNLQLLHPGIKLNIHERQDTIFDNIANKEHEDHARKYFTIGVIVPENWENFKLETLLSAIIKCRIVIPNLQTVIVSEKEEIKNYSWLIKKMKLEGAVWLIGKQANIRKWFDNFDVYAVLSSETDLSDIKSILSAMEAGLAVIAPEEAELEDFIVNGKNGLFYKSCDSESLAQCLIKLEQNKRLLSQFGVNAKSSVINNSDLVKTVDNFEKIINATA